MNSVLSAEETLLYPQNRSFIKYGPRDLAQKEEVIQNLSVKIGVMPELTSEFRRQAFSTYLLFSIVVLPGGFVVLFKSTTLWVEQSQLADPLNSSEILTLAVMFMLGVLGIILGFLCLRVVWELLHPRTDKVQKIYRDLLDNGRITRGKLIDLKIVGPMQTKIEYEFHIGNDLVKGSYIVTTRSSPKHLIDNHLVILFLDKNISVPL